jgi:hypothetical protein
MLEQFDKVRPAGREDPYERSHAIGRSLSLGQFGLSATRGEIRMANPADPGIAPLYRIEVMSGQLH